MQGAQSVYRVVWLLVCGLLGVIGGMAASTLSLGTIITVFVMAAITGGVVSWLVLIPEGDNPRLPPGGRRVVATSTVLSGAGCLALVGVGMLLGAAMAVLLLVFVIGGSPHVVRIGLRRFGRHGHVFTSPRAAGPRGYDGTYPDSVPEPSAPTEPDPEQVAAARPAPADLSDEELSLAWRASFPALQRATSPAQRLRIVAERQEYLDELERRSPRGLAAWLASGARAAGDPRPYLQGESGAGRSPIDWDGLIHGSGK
ncbi:hypothetical protein AB0H36_45640 [Kribbella sp. NPDC050820]|uniref:hypothetical protein n=1 Tax=Kribbella sp. NPDC050820 TaxID=3155408 RepID=UPI0033C2E3F3